MLETCRNILAVLSGSVVQKQSISLLDEKVATNTSDVPALRPTKKATNTSNAPSAATDRGQC